MSPPKGHAPYPGCETGGRPKIYTDEVIEKYADEFMRWWNNPFNVWFKDFCLDKGIHPKYMTMWADANDKFKDAYEFGKEMQESRLVNGGLRKTFSDASVNRALIHCHGWKSDKEIIVNNGMSIADYIRQGDGESKELVINERNDK